MARSKAQKAESHERIVRIAAAKFRELGLDGIGVADLMAAAGLTHGGFYSHFESRDHLVAEALDQAFAENDKVQEAVPHSGRAALAAYIDQYLTETHRDSPGKGCAVAALAGDIVRAGAAARDVFTDRLRRYRDWIAERIGGDEDAANEKAAVLLSTLVGALVLSRAVTDRELSDSLLQAARTSLHASIGEDGKGR